MDKRGKRKREREEKEGERGWGEGEKRERDQTKRKEKYSIFAYPLNNYTAKANRFLFSRVATLVAD